MMTQVPVEAHGDEQAGRAVIGKRCVWDRARHCGPRPSDQAIGQRDFRLADDLAGLHDLETLLRQPRLLTSEL